MYAQTSRKQNIPTVVHINREEYKTSSTSKQTRVLRLNQINQKKKIAKKPWQQTKKKKASENLSPVGKLWP